MIWLASGRREPSCRRRPRRVCGLLRLHARVAYITAQSAEADDQTWTANENRPGLVALTCIFTGGAAGNRTRVLRHSLKASPCAVRYVSTRISCSREQVRMTIPVAVWCPATSRDRTYRFVPLADARVRAEGSPGLTDQPSLRQRGRSRADWNRRLIGCNDAYGGLLPAPARFP
jgi:hypothetical protein